uniref:Pyridine nucleotide-disulfide oxidoreductase domain-containing protein 2 n=1 Tax=Ciona savignyi TaxID=51511 RepID=H2Z0Q6_CIOSA
SGSHRGVASYLTDPQDLKSSYDAVVVGAGHNGLISATYLAKHGLKVAVLERRHLIGGAAVTEEIIPGYKFSRASYVLSLLRPTIIKELELKKHGLEVYPRSTAAFTPILNKAEPNKHRYLMLSSDRQKTFEEISKFSEKDAKAYFEYEEMIDAMASAVKPLLEHPPPTNKGSILEVLRSLSPSYATARKLGKDLPLFYELVTAPISKILSRWFESDALKATLATDGVIGAMLSPESAGSGYVLLHHVIGEVNNVPGTWGYVRGGMGSVSNSIAAAAKQHGVDIFVSQEVEKIDVKNEVVKGVALKNGKFVASKHVLSNATPHVTFKKLLPNNATSNKDYMQKIDQFDYTSPVTKINVAVNTLPNFISLPNVGHGVVGEQHKGTIHLNSEHMTLIHDAYLDAMNGRPSKVPMIEMCIPSSVDPTLAPPGHHVISLFTQYTPYYLDGGRKWTDADKSQYVNTVFENIEKYAPGFQESVVGYDALLPSDLEEVFGLTGGNIFHGSMSLDQLLFCRPTTAMNSHQTPVKGLYLCGSGTHPGGGVMGASGKLAAMSLIKDNK